VVVVGVGVAVLMTKQNYDLMMAQYPQFHPLPGRCIIHLDPAPAKVGLIHIPEKAQGKEIKAVGYTGVVLAINYDREKWKGWTKESSWQDRAVVGDRVCVGLHADELTEEVVVLHNDLVVAVI
jgi:hypothetical protein